MNESRREDLIPSVRVMQIIIVCLAIGILLFGVMVAAFLVKPAQWQTRPGLLTTMAVPVAAIAIVLSFIVPRIMITASRRRIAAGTWISPAQGGVMPDRLAALGDDGQLVIVYQTALIVGAALCEGPAFFALVAAIIEKSLPGLAIAAFCLLIVLARFPTFGRVEDWLDSQRIAIEADRLLPR